MYRLMKEICRFDPQIGIGFSLDGIDQMHDHIRGVAGAYQRVMRSLDKVRTLGVKNIRLGFTASKDNVSQLSQVYKLANTKGVEFSCAVAQDSNHYFKTKHNVTVDKDMLRQELEYIVANELKSFSPKKWGRAFFAQGLYAFAQNYGRPFGCGAGGDFFFINPYGDVYPCNVLDRVMGNIASLSFEQVWASSKSSEIREAVKRCQHKCWMICTARTAIMQHKGKTMAWILKHKLKSHLGLPSIGEQ